ncbi:MAG TPA: extracellular solute-binding protein [Geminicoccaceae bacterium]|jgi:inositol-phosphate transport system substrate-binding protein|nr:extracellular solute-binding protein [Geminicoccaceae bacterium]
MTMLQGAFTGLLATALLASTTLAPAPAAAEDITLQLWARADPSGPLRAGNIVAATAQLNRMLEAAGSEDRVVIEVFENNAAGFDADALDLFKAFAVDKGPDIFVAAHEWIGAFVEEGLVYQLDEHIAANPELYGDVISSLWNAVAYKGHTYGVPQDSEVRMFFYDKEMLRKIGKDEAFIEGLPDKVESGEFTIYDMTDLAKEVVDAGAAKYGIVHRPNVGPDFQMLMKSFGIDQYDAEAGKLQMSESKLTAFFEWLKYSVDAGVIPANMTAWSWDEVHASFRTDKTSFIKFHGIWNVPPQLEARGLTKDTYFDAIGWTHSPAAEQGGEPANLSHPIIYAVSAESEHPELAAYIVGLASQNMLNTEHAVTTGHTPINYGQAAMPRFIEDGWALRAGAPMLEYASFMPNHASIGQYNALLFKGIEAVETGRLDPADAAAFVVEELQAELGDEVVILD